MRISKPYFINLKLRLVLVDFIELIEIINF